jgi:hypothetical protein
VLLIVPWVTMGEGVATHIVQRIAIGQLRRAQGAELGRRRVQFELGGQDGMHAASRSYVRQIGKHGMLMKFRPAHWQRRILSGLKARGFLRQSR